MLFGYTAGAELEGEIFSRQLASLSAKESEYAAVDTAGAISLAEESLKTRYGTAFIVSDPANEEKFPCLAGVQRCLFRPSEGNLSNVVVIGGGEALEGFRRVIYMDKPPRAVACGRETYVNTELSGRGLFSGVSVDRDAFKEIFVLLRSLSGKKFTKAVDFYRENRVQCNQRQFLFALEVFGELGIFVCRNGMLSQDVSVKSELKNSAVYRRAERVLGDD